MIEIKYDGKKLRIIHDNEEYTEEEIKKHIGENGHGREQASFGAPVSMYWKCRDISKAIDDIVKEKEGNRKFRNQ